MTKVTDTTIELTRGDSLLVRVSISRNGEIYTPEQGDTIMFYLKHQTMNMKRSAYIDEEPVISKDVPIDTMMLTLYPQDTKELSFGEYVYDLEITFANGFVDTFINNGRFVLLPEVG